MNYELELEKNKVRLLVKALKQTDDMVLITDVNGIIEYANDAVVRKTGYDKSELIGREASIFKSGKTSDEFYKNLWDTILSGKNYHDVIMDKTKDGRIYYADLRITPILDENQKVKNFIATSTDITKVMELKNKLKKLATVDALTEAYNRYKINDVINIQIAKYQRSKKCFSLLMLDIDHFKNINDTYGHDVGDIVLKSICKLISQNIRTSDIFGRWGGEEFIILLENTHKEEAFSIAEKLRKVIEASIIDGKYKITMSIGVTEYKGAGLQSREDLIKKADEVLYKAKENGRNQVVA